MHRPTRVAGGVLSTQWTTLQKAGWLCLERMDSDDTIANTKEEIYFTPSTICNTSAVQTFSKSDYIEVRDIVQVFDQITNLKLYWNCCELYTTL